MESIDDLKKSNFDGQVGGYPVGMGPRENGRWEIEESDFRIL